MRKGYARKGWTCIETGSSREMLTRFRHSWGVRSDWIMTVVRRLTGRGLLYCSYPGALVDTSTYVLSCDEVDVCRGICLHSLLEPREVQGRSSSLTSAKSSLLLLQSRLLLLQSRLISLDLAYLALSISLQISRLRFNKSLVFLTVHCDTLLGYNSAHPVGA